MIYVINSLDDPGRFIADEERWFVNNEVFFSTKSLSSTLEKRRVIPDPDPGSPSGWLLCSGRS